VPLKEKSLHLQKFGIFERVIQRATENTSPLVFRPEGLTGRAEMFPVGFWVSGRHSGEILPTLSPPVKKKTPPEGFR